MSVVCTPHMMGSGHLTPSASHLDKPPTTRHITLGFWIKQASEYGHITVHTYYVVWLLVCSVGYGNICWQLAKQLTCSMFWF